MTRTMDQSTATSGVCLSVLGAIEATRGEQFADLGGPKQRIVLGVLIVRAGAHVATETLIREAYGDDAPSGVRRSVQTFVSNLRRELGDVIVSVRDGYRLDIPRHMVDTYRFEDGVEEGRELLATNPSAASTALREALAEWRGHPYADVDHRDVLYPETTRLTELRVTALEARVDADLALGRHRALVAEVGALTEEHPYRERFRAQHMLALYRSGRQSEALRAYEKTRRMLNEELGIDPTPELRTLEQQILQHEPSLDLDSGAGGTDPAVSIAPVSSMPGYELRDEVVRGADWVLWRAYQPSVGREVALRVIDPSLANRPDFVRRFEIDALTVARLDHPNVVPLFDYWRDLSGAYLVTRWMNGPRLEDEIVPAGLNEEDVGRLVEHIGSALAAAHDVGVGHGGVSPAVIFRDGTGAFLIGDFGIARHSALHPGSDARRHDTQALRSTVEQAAAESLVVAAFIEATSEATTVRELVEAWRTAVPARSRNVAEIYSPTRNPYRGLSAFTYANAMDFHGRSAVVAEILAAMATSRFVGLVGPSGVGKSSVVQAGVVPSLAGGGLPGSEAWFMVVMTPGAHPFEALASALLRSGTSAMADLDEDLSRDERGIARALKRMFPAGADVVLVIDQFEELFTLTTDADVRERFVSGLAAAVASPDSTTRVLVTLRADFFDEPLSHPVLGDLIRQATVPLAAPTTAELREMIEAPAAGVGVGYEARLVETIVADVKDEPGRLPLLAYALRRIFDHRTSDVIHFADYEAVGGVLGALGRQADEIGGNLGEPMDATVRQVFLRLVRLNDLDRPTRRRVTISELNRLESNPTRVPAIISAFAGGRLLTLDRDPVTRGPTVEVAHEALFTEWSRLGSWIDARRDDLTMRRKLLVEVEDWDAASRDPSMLLAPGSLARYEGWMDSTDLSLSLTEREFIDASRSKEEASRRRQTRRRSLVLAAISVAAVIALILAGVATSTARRARALAADALIGDAQFSMTTGEVEEAAIGLVESYALEPSRDALPTIGQIINGHEVWGTAIGAAGAASAVRPAVDWDRGIVAVSGATNVVSLLSLASGETIGTIDAPAPVGPVAFLSDGTLVTGDEFGGVIAWDVTSRQPVSDVHDIGVMPWDIVVSPDDIVVVASSQPADSPFSVVRSLELTESGLWAPVVDFPVGEIAADDQANAARLADGIEIFRLALSNDGQRLLTMGRPVLVASWDLVTGDRRAHHVGSGPGGVWSAAFSPNGELLVTGHQDRTLLVRDPESLEPIGRPTEPSDGQQRTLFFTPEGDSIVSAGQGGMLVWDFSAEGVLGTNPRRFGSTTALFTQRHASSPDGDFAVAAVGDRVRMYSVSPGVSPEPHGIVDEYRDVVIDGGVAWLAGRGGGIYRWDRSTGGTHTIPVGKRVQALTLTEQTDEVVFGTVDGTVGRASLEQWTDAPAHGGPVWEVEASPEGSVIVSISADNTIAIRDPETLELVRDPFGPTTDGGQSGLKALAFLDDATIVTTGWDGHLRRWDIVTGTQTFDMEIIDDQLNAVVVLGEERVAVGDETGVISIVDLASESVIQRLTGHTAAVRGLALSSDGRTLASGSQDNTVRLWATDTGAQVGLFWHSGAVRSVAFVEDGDTLVSVDINGSALEWDAQWETWPDRLCDWLAGWDVERSWSSVMGEARYDPACNSG